MTYDAQGNLTTITNALSKITTITVNAQGQPLTIKDPLNNTTTFTYEAGDLVKVKKIRSIGRPSGFWMLRGASGT